jgi:hypothetical protein
MEAYSLKSLTFQADRQSGRAAGILPRHACPYKRKGHRLTQFRVKLTGAEEVPICFPQLIA